MGKNLRLKAKDNFKVGLYSEKKGYFDTAISRYYYYLYQNIIAYINDNYSEKFKLRDKTKDKEGIHQVTIMFFQKQLIANKLITNLGDMKLIANILRLRQIRNDSDYNNKIIKDKNTLTRTFKYEFDMIKELLEDINIIKE